MSDITGNTWDHEIIEIVSRSATTRCYANCEKPVKFMGFFTQERVAGRTRRERRFMCAEHAEKWRKKYDPKAI